MEVKIISFWQRKELIKAYFKYKTKAVNAHGIHSPFVFEFYNQVIKKAKFVEDKEIQKVYQSFRSSKEVIEVTDLGAGSRVSKSNKRKLAEIAKIQSIEPKYGKLLSRIIAYYKLKNCIELGTSLGIGTAYLAQNAQKVYSIEGCPNIAQKAASHLSKMNNVVQKQGDFAAILPSLLNEIEELDLVYIDGNHRYQATLDYFNMILEKAHNNTFIVFDDINWSEEMRKAWDEICVDDRINVSMEFFRMGIVLKRKEQVKQHFVLKY
ncbi:class I SAM-dependent methyltransferase [Paracrocinitomix mangrovi]|uniref:O-methyltransferase n=1 Tax=Paracrocinitomix mangrovi TaxID=2862509 RepID=UPI001C8D14E4|nr:class I SAM-dependent methyltransferase [Paracrocinitomix mangrovi]UKN03136.1 class I SAM-dependent methyltransferase [Paracrocinitomix mangrovi]